MQKTLGKSGKTPLEKQGEFPMNILKEIFEQLRNRKKKQRNIGIFYYIYLKSWKENQ